MPRKINPLAGMRADQKRRIPVEPLRLNPLAFDRSNSNPFSAAFIETHQSPILAFRVDCVWIFGINPRMKSVTTIRHEPIGIDDAGGVVGPRRSSNRTVILRSAENVIKGFVVIRCHIVKLGDRQIRMELPIQTLIEAFVNAPVATNQQIIRICRIHPYRMIVHVF